VKVTSVQKNQLLLPSHIHCKGVQENRKYFTFLNLKKKLY